MHMGTLKSLVVAAAAALPLLSAETPNTPIPVNLQVGQKITILLDGNPTTGFIWMLADALPADSPVQVDLSLVARERGGILCGTPTPTQLTISGVKTGEATVRVVYRRPWEKGRPNVAEKCFSVEVAPAGK